jgi:hypothetical protein
MSIEHGNEIHVYRSKLLEYCADEDYYKLKHYNVMHNTRYKQCDMKIIPMFEKLPSFTPNINAVMFNEYERVLGLYEPDSKTIAVNKLSYFPNSVSFFSILFHEIIHSFDVKGSTSRERFYLYDENVPLFDEGIADVGAYLCLCELYYVDDVINRFPPIRYSLYRDTQLKSQFNSFQSFVKSVFKDALSLFEEVKECGIIQFVSDYLLVNPELKTM